MTLVLSQSSTAVCPYIRASFLASGGVSPYAYEVLAGGAGGTINASTGAYTAPAAYSENPKYRYDTIRVTDADAATAEARIMVGSPLLLLCDIIQRELELAAGRVYLWDQKIMQPTDAGLYVAVSQVGVVPIGSSNRFNPDTNKSEQFVSVQGVIDIDLISRDASALFRKEALILALGSDYSRRQQDGNSFSVGSLPTRFVNLSDVDGAAIPYRFKATVKMQYVYTKAQDTQYYESFQVSGAISTDQEFEFDQDT